MPNPSISDVHVNRPLTNLSVAYIQDQMDFIADKVFPIVPVQKQSDLYFTYDKFSWMNSVAKFRAPGTESAGGGFTIQKSQYYASVKAVHMDIDNQTLSNQDDPLNLQREATMWVTRQMLLRREIDFLGAYLAPNVWQGYNNAGTISDYALPNGQGWNQTGSNPFLVVDTLKSAIASATSFTPNTLIMTPDVFYATRNNVSTIDRIKFVQQGFYDVQGMAKAFGITNLYVAKAVSDIAAEGQTDNIGYIAKNKALLCYVPPSAGLYMPSAGYTFSWTGLQGSGGLQATVSDFYMPAIKSTRIEGEMAYDQKLVAPDLGVLITNIIQ